MTAGPEAVTRSISLAGDTAECGRLTDFVRQYLQEHAVATQELMYDLQLVIEEVLVNIIHHGYGKIADDRIEVEIELHDNSLTLTFSDSASAFDPLAQKFDSADDHCDGGMGIELVKSLTDSQHYRRERGRNILTLSKKL